MGQKAQDPLGSLVDLFSKRHRLMTCARMNHFLGKMFFQRWENPKHRHTERQREWQQMKDSWKQTMRKPLSRESSTNLERSKAYSNSNLFFFPTKNPLFSLILHCELLKTPKFYLICDPYRSKPVEALKTALEGSPPKTRDERCKVSTFFFFIPF